MPAPIKFEALPIQGSLVAGDRIVMNRPLGGGLYKNFIVPFQQLVGPQGFQGIQGIQGIQGETGDPAPTDDPNINNRRYSRVPWSWATNNFYDLVTQPWPGSATGVTIFSGREPSGIIWHPALQKWLFVDDGLTDGGRLYVMDEDGGAVKWVSLINTSARDLEDLCYADPSSDFIYCLSEEPKEIYEVSLTALLAAASGSVLAVARTWATSVVPGTGNLAQEGMTFVPDPSNAEGGLFYVGGQHDGKAYVLELKIKTSAVDTTVTHKTGAPYNSPLGPVLGGATDLACLEYDRATGNLYWLYDFNNRIIVTDALGLRIIADLLEPGSALDYEGIGLGPRDTMGFANDIGSVVVYQYPQGHGVDTSVASQLPDSRQGGDLRSDGLTPYWWTPRDGFQLFDDFLGGVRLFSTSGTVTVTLTDPPHFGIATLSTGGTADGWGALLDGSNAFAVGNSMQFGYGRAFFETLVRLPILSTEIEFFMALIGWVSGAVVDPGDNALFFTYNYSAAVLEWEMVKRIATVETIVTTAVPVVAGAWTRLGIEVAWDGSSAEFFVNGLSVGVVTGLPTAAHLKASAVIVKSVGTTPRSMDLDYMLTDLKLNTQR